MTLEDLREDRRPAELWYWGDWFSSFDVRACSLAARGLWVDLLGIMSRGQTKGALIINGSKPDIKTLAKIIGAPEKEIETRLKELERHSVFSRLEDGTIINRRMYRASELSRTRAAAGKKGASSRWQINSKIDSKAMATLEDEDDIEDDIANKEEGVRGGRIGIVLEGGKPIRFENITEKDLALWEKSYPACDLEVELSKMISWLRENPKKKKKNYGRFVTNWLSTAQDRGGTRGVGPKQERRIGAQQPKAKSLAEKEYEAALEAAEDIKVAELKGRLDKGEITQGQAQDELSDWRVMWNEKWKQDHPF